MFGGEVRASLGLLTATAILLNADPAFAYMGAGAGLSMIGSILSFLFVLLVMVLGFFWYPLKRLFRKMRGTDEGPKESDPE